MRWSASSKNLQQGASVRLLNALVTTFNFWRSISVCANDLLPAAARATVSTKTVTGLISFSFQAAT
jgi:hypothetical protein